MSQRRRRPSFREMAPAPRINILYVISTVCLAGLIVHWLSQVSVESSVINNMEFGKSLQFIHFKRTHGGVEASHPKFPMKDNFSLSEVGHGLVDTAEAKVVKEEMKSSKKVRRRKLRQEFNHTTLLDYKLRNHPPNKRNMLELNLNKSTGWWEARYINFAASVLSGIDLIIPQKRVLLGIPEYEDEIDQNLNNVLDWAINVVSRKDPSGIKAEITPIVFDSGKSSPKRTGNFGTESNKPTSQQWNIYNPLEYVGGFLKRIFGYSQYFNQSENDETKIINPLPKRTDVKLWDDSLKELTVNQRGKRRDKRFVLGWLGLGRGKETTTEAVFDISTTAIPISSEAEDATAETEDCERICNPLSHSKNVTEIELFSENTDETNINGMSDFESLRNFDPLSTTEVIHNLQDTELSTIAQTSSMEFQTVLSFFLSECSQGSDKRNTEINKLLQEDFSDEFVINCIDLLVQSENSSAEFADDFGSGEFSDGNSSFRSEESLKPDTGTRFRSQNVKSLVTLGRILSILRNLNSSEDLDRSDSSTADNANASNSGRNSRFINLKIFSFLDFLGSGNEARMASDTIGQIEFDTEVESVSNVTPNMDEKCSLFFQCIINCSHRVTKPNLFDILSDANLKLGGRSKKVGLERTEIQTIKPPESDSLINESQILKSLSDEMILINSNTTEEQRVTISSATITSIATSMQTPGLEPKNEFTSRPDTSAASAFLRERSENQPDQFTNMNSSELSSNFVTYAETKSENSVSNFLIPNTGNDLEITDKSSLKETLLPKKFSEVTFSPFDAIDSSTTTSIHDQDDTNSANDFTNEYDQRLIDFGFGSGESRSLISTGATEDFNLDQMTPKLNSNTTSTSTSNPFTDHRFILEENENITTSSETQNRSFFEPIFGSGEGRNVEHNFADIQGKENSSAMQGKIFDSLLLGSGDGRNADESSINEIAASSGGVRGLGSESHHLNTSGQYDHSGRLLGNVPNFGSEEVSMAKSENNESRWFLGNILDFGSSGDDDGSNEGSGNQGKFFGSKLGFGSGNDKAIEPAEPTRSGKDERYFGIIIGHGIGDERRIDDTNATSREKNGSRLFFGIPDFGSGDIIFEEQEERVTRPQQLAKKLNGITEFGSGDSQDVNESAFNNRISTINDQDQVTEVYNIESSNMTLNVQRQRNPRLENDQDCNDDECSNEFGSDNLNMDFPDYTSENKSEFKTTNNTCISDCSISGDRKLTEDANATLFELTTKNITETELTNSNTQIDTPLLKESNTIQPCGKKCDERVHVTTALVHNDTGCENCEQKTLGISNPESSKCKNETCDSDVSDIHINQRNTMAIDKLANQSLTNNTSITVFKSQDTLKSLNDSSCNGCKEREATSDAPDFNVSGDTNSSFNTTEFKNLEPSDTSGVSKPNSTKCDSCENNSGIQPWTGMDVADEQTSPAELDADYSFSTNPDEDGFKSCAYTEECNSTLNERCVLRDNSLVCDCGRSYARHLETQRCETIVVLKTRMKFPKERYTRDLRNPHSKKYREKKNEAEETMWLLLNDDPELRKMVANVEVLGFQRGSLVILWNIIIVTKENETMKDAKQLLDVSLHQALAHNATRMKIPLRTDRMVLLSISSAMNPCTRMDLNYCSSNAMCRVDEDIPGGFRCSCKEGYVDNSPETSHPGEICQNTCELGYCGEHGKCLVHPNGATSCICESWYLGDRCEISNKVTIASTVVLCIILLIAIICFICCIRRRRQHAGYGESGDFQRGEFSLQLLGQNSMPLHDIIAFERGLCPDLRISRIATPSMMLAPLEPPVIKVVPPSMSDSMDFSVDSTFDTPSSTKSRCTQSYTPGTPYENC